MAQISTFKNHQVIFSSFSSLWALSLLSALSGYLIFYSSTELSSRVWLPSNLESTRLGPVWTSWFPPLPSVDNIALYAVLRFPGFHRRNAKRFVYKPRANLRPQVDLSVSSWRENKKSCWDLYLYSIDFILNWTLGRYLLRTVPPITQHTAAVVIAIYVYSENRDNTLLTHILLSAIPVTATGTLYVPRYNIA